MYFTIEQIETKSLEEKIGVEELLPAVKFG